MGQNCCASEKENIDDYQFTSGAAQASLTSILAHSRTGSRTIEPHPMNISKGSRLIGIKVDNADDRNDDQDEIDDAVVSDHNEEDGGSDDAKSIASYTSVKRSKPTMTHREGGAHEQSADQESSGSESSDDFAYLNEVLKKTSAAATSAVQQAVLEAKRMSQKQVPASNDMGRQRRLLKSLPTMQDQPRQSNLLALPTESPQSRQSGVTTSIYKLSQQQDNTLYKNSFTLYSGATTSIQKLGSLQDDGSLAGVEMASLQESQVSFVPSSEQDYRDVQNAQYVLAQRTPAATEDPIPEMIIPIPETDDEYITHTQPFEEQSDRKTLQYAASAKDFVPSIQGSDKKLKVIKLSQFPLSPTH